MYKYKVNDKDLGDDSGEPKPRKGEDASAILRKTFASGGIVQNPHKERRGAGGVNPSAGKGHLRVNVLHDDDAKSKMVLKKAQEKAAKGQKQTEYPFVPDGKNIRKK